MLGVQVPGETFKVKYGWGKRLFLEKMERIIERENLEEVPLAQTVPSRPTKVDIFESVAEEFGITVEGLVERSDQDAYRAAVYLLRRVVNLSQKSSSWYIWCVTI